MITSTRVIVPANRHPAFDDDTYFDDGQTFTDLAEVVQPLNEREKALMRMLRGSPG